MAKPGRKSKRTPETVAKILDFLRSGNTRGTSARASGISPDTFSDWCNRFPDFADAVKEAESEAASRYLAHIEAAAIKGSWQAAAWVLERRYHQEWARKDRLELIQSVRDMARSINEDEEAAVRQAETILRELRSAQRG